jgi:hypothetical protein
MSGARFKGVTSIDNMLGWQKSSFSEFLKIDSSGISEYTTEQIKAKASVLGLTDSLTEQAVALGKDATSTEKIIGKTMTFGEALKDGSVGVDTLAKGLKNSSLVDDETRKALDYVKDKFGETSDEYKQTVENIITGNGKLDSLSDTIIDLGEDTAITGTIFSGLGKTLKGVFAEIKAGATALATNPMTYLVAGITAAVGTAYYMSKAFTRASESASESASEYEEAKSSLESLNSEYETTQEKIEELEALQTDGTITLAQEVELQNLQNQSAELETQIKLQKQLVDLKALASANSAQAASDTGQSWLEKLQEKHGGLLGFLSWIGSYQTYYDEDTGTFSSLGADWENQDTTVSGQVDNNIAQLEEYQDELDTVNEKIKNLSDDASESEISELTKEQERLSEAIANTTSDLQSQSDTLQAWIDQCKDEDGNVIKGMESSVQEWQKKINDIANYGKTDAEKDLNNLNSFFSASSESKIKKRLTEIVKASGNASDALKEVRDIPCCFFAPEI